MEFVADFEKVIQDVERTVKVGEVESVLGSGETKFSKRIRCRRRITALVVEEE